MNSRKHDTSHGTRATESLMTMLTWRSAGCQKLANMTRPQKSKLSIQTLLQSLNWTLSAFPVSQLCLLGAHPHSSLEVGNMGISGGGGRGSRRLECLCRIVGNSCPSVRLGGGLYMYGTSSLLSSTTPGSLRFCGTSRGTENTSFLIWLG